jgi:dihydropyrimidinase
LNKELNLKDWTASSPAGAEANAAERFVKITRDTGARGYMVHMSSKEAVTGLTELFKDGRENIYIETTSAYCCMNNEDPAGKFAKMVPPIREKESQDALWEAVKKGLVSTFGSDNVSCSSVHKNFDKWMEVLPGYPVVGDQVSALLTEGYHNRGISWMTIIEKVTKTPAEAYGIYPRKGTIAVGSDADLVILDLEKEKTVDPGENYSFSDFSLFQGRKFKGLPVKVIKAGVLAAENGKVLVPPGTGKYLPKKLAKDI